MRTLILLLAPLLLLVASCGGGSGDSEPTLTFSATPLSSVDGTVDDHGATVTSGVVLAPGGIAVGDSTVDNEVRGFFVFDITALPAGARVQAATLEIRQIGTNGMPYVDLGRVHIDHVAVVGGLSGADFSSTSLSNNFAVVSDDDTAGAKIVDVTSQVGADGIALRSRSAFRIRFTMATDHNGDTDSAHFQDGNDSEGSGILPRLTITYKP